MVNFRILPTTMENWELVKAHNVYALQLGIDRDKPHIRIINWKKIMKLYKLLKDTTETERELRI